MVTGKQTSQLIGQLYESIGDLAALTDTITKLASFGGGISAQFGFLERSGRWLQAAVVGVDPIGLERYLQYYVASDPRARYALENPGRFFNCTQMVRDVKEFEHTALVEHLDYFEGRYMVGAYFPIGGSLLGGVGVFRPRRHGQFTEEEIATADLLVPHLQRAMGLHARMGRLESAAFTMEALVDRLLAPVLLVDASGLLKHANAAGFEALRRSTCISLLDGRVEPVHSEHGAEFRALVAGVSVEPSAESVPSRNSIRLADAQGATAVLTAYSLRGMPALTAQPQACVALFLSYPGSEASIDAASMQILFGLTDAETRLAAWLHRGGSLPDFCRAAGLSRETAKSQLEALFEKTGTHRQAELVALLGSAVSSLLK